MKDQLRDLVLHNGFKHVYQELMVIATECITKYTTELSFIDTLLEPAYYAPQPVSVVEEPLPTPIRNVFEPADVTKNTYKMEVIHLGDDAVIEYKLPLEKAPEAKTVRRMKVIRKGGKTIPVKAAKEEESVVAPESIAAPPESIAAPPENIAVVESPANPEEPPKRTSKEIKKWQREQESLRRKYMKANNIRLEDVLDRAKIELYISEGWTKSRVSRELTGQSESELSQWLRSGDRVSPVPPPLSLLGTGCPPYPLP